MKASELRIGNYVKRITYSFNGIVKVKAEDFADLDGNELDFFQIPLTEQWLIDFGFEEFNDPIRDRFCIVEDSVLKYQILFYDGMFTMSNKDKPIVVESVHQLQNLYFALTNKELKLK